MPNYNFRKDLPIAKETEKEVAGLIEKVYGAEIIGFENTNKYDFSARINGKEYTFEVKEDFTCEKTGNIGLEFGCRGKPSGIETSQADFYIYKIHTKDFGIQYVIHKVDTLKTLIENKAYFRIVNGGDIGSNSMNYLFKYDVFVNSGKKMLLDKII